MNKEIITETATHKTTKNTFPDYSESHKAPSEEWASGEVSRHPEIQKMILDLLGRFFPLQELVTLVASELECVRPGLPDNLLVAESSVKAALRYLEESTNTQWNQRLSLVFSGEYPLFHREAWYNGHIACGRYQKLLQLSEKPYTFSVRQLYPISSPRDLLCKRLVPSLFDVAFDTKGQPYLERTAEVERFLNNDKEAVVKSCLHEEIIYNRPTYGVKRGWQKYELKQLPRKVVAAAPTIPTFSEEILSEFLADLKESFAWKSTTTQQNQIATYLGYLLQPMLSHLCLGQMPAYCFLGPTKAGKGYLSGVLPGIIYHRRGDATVITRKIPKESYEFEVLMDAAKNALYIDFDETKNATDEEIKNIDAFCTQTEVQVRKFRLGYYQLPNLYTIALTAVHRTFSDETYGRLAIVQLQESRSDKIAEFHNKWRLRGPEILAALYCSLQKVKINLNNLPNIPDRRPGFALMAFTIEAIFGLKPDYSIESASNEILDDICKMHESGPTAHRIKEKWERYSPRQLAIFLAEERNTNLKKSSVLALVNTALGYTSTQRHPAFKESGYEAESGRFYHIELREEGRVSKRTLIYVKELVSQPKRQSAPSDFPFASTEPQQQILQ